MESNGADSDWFASAAAPTMARMLRHVGPNWFATAMGTGMVANAAMLLPADAPARDELALAVWLLASALLAALAGVTAARWRRHRDHVLGDLRDPAMAPFLGAVPMAVLTVGAGALLAGRDLLGHDAALIVAGALWAIGTVAGVGVSVAVPPRLARRRGRGLQAASATWLLAVVPPMVAASTGAALAAALPHGPVRAALLIASAALLVGSLLAALPTIGLVWARLLVHGAGPVHAAPTLFVVLGPLGQSVTAIHLLALAAPGTLSFGERALGDLAVGYGVAVLAFALAWLALAAAITLRAARGHGGLPFSLAWWSFTFPIGTCATGSSELALRTGAPAATWLAAILFALLVAGWLAAAGGTLRGLHMRTLVAPASAPAGA